MDVERELRSSRPEARPELVSMISERIERTPRRSYAGFRIAFGAGLTAGLLAAVATVGGVGFAASSATKVAKSVIRITHTSHPRVVNHSSAADQYRKVKVCHKGKVIEVSEASVPTHRAHGDKIGVSGKPGSKCSLQARKKGRRHGAPAFTG